MKVRLNGDVRHTQAATVGELIDELGLAGQAVAVELNRDVIPRRQHDATPLKADDVIEIVTLVGGG